MKFVKRLIVFVILLFGAIVTLFPVVWTLLTSLKTDVQMFSVPPTVFPHPVTFEHYESMIKDQFTSYLTNSLFIAVISCGISVLFAIPAAYAFARFSSKPTGGAMFAGIAAIRMVPQAAMVLPYFLIIRHLKLNDTVWALVITYIPFQCSLMIWILKNFFGTLPIELEEAAEIDGLNTIGKLIKVVVPLSKASIGVAIMLGFLFSWNEFMFALALTSTKKSQTLTIGIAGYVTSFQTFWGKMSAMGILVMIPALLVSLLFQRDLAIGLTAGAVKG